ncbi:MAG: His/Gly/Thr/Pro-type tRNA ligase C-terminal domain-containing protein, partial [Actinomycetes bacterium]
QLGLRLFADPRVVMGSHWITGANEKDKHVRFVTHGRDFTIEKFVESAEVRAGDTCPNCATPVVIDRAIEIGHIFQLGRKYAEALDFTVLDKDGKSQVVTMGSYGIGVSRAVAAIAEQTHDEIGLCWPREVAPADIHIVATGKEDLPFDTAQTLAEELEARGMRVMLDDRRDASPGVKFKDAELIGIPFIVIVGKALAEGKVELRNRKSGEKTEVELTTAVSDILAVVTAS